jgi:hypothetical protein
VFNHTEWGSVGGNASTTCFAGATNTPGDSSCLANSEFLRANSAHNPRILQLALKFMF